MTVKIVTDSTSDLPPEVAQELGITVVPLYVRFGKESYRDGVDLSAEEFYRRLVQGDIFPSTTAPSPGDFTQVYQRLAQETDEIISIHISTKLSSTCNAALLGREDLNRGCRVEVVDSLLASMGCGLLAIVAAKAAAEGAGLDEIVEMARRVIPRTHFFGLVDNLEYLHKGGRIGRAQAFLGTKLRVKPILAVRDGEVRPVERVRTISKALDRLCELVKERQPFKEMAVLYSTTPEGADQLMARLAPLFPREKMYKSVFGPVIGTYLGPGTLAVTLMEGEA